MSNPTERFGRTDAPLIHFAHANGYPPGVYRRFLEALGQDYTILASRLRPLWPDSAPQALTSWHDIAADIIATLDAHGLRGIVGMGHSLGGVATMYAALARPDLFSRLVLIEPVLLPRHVLEALKSVPHRDQIETPLVLSALRRLDRWRRPEDAFKRFRKKRIFARLSDDALWDYVNFALRPDGDTYTLVYPKLWEARIYSLAPVDVWECVPQLTPPTLAVRGAETDTISAESWHLWQTLQPAAAFVQLPDVGHLLTMEQPDRVAAVVRRYLSDTQPPTDHP